MFNLWIILAIVKGFRKSNPIIFLISFLFIKSSMFSFFFFRYGRIRTSLRTFLKMKVFVRAWWTIKIICGEIPLFLYVLYNCTRRGQLVRAFSNDEKTLWGQPENDRRAKNSRRSMIFSSFFFWFRKFLFYTSYFWLCDKNHRRRWSFQTRNRTSTKNRKHFYPVRARFVPTGRDTARRRTRSRCCTVPSAAARSVYDGTLQKHGVLTDRNRHLYVYYSRV